MSDIFMKDGSEPFELFSVTHLITLAVILVVCLALYIYKNQLEAGLMNKVFRYGLAAVLLLSELSLVWWMVFIGNWTVQYSLPLHLSSLSLFLSSLLLITKSYRLFEFTFFVGLGSAIQAMITPDIHAYTFPHYRYVNFFVSHGGIVVANIFMVVVERYRPMFKSVVRAFLYVNVYTIIILFVNLGINGNYMYIMRKPLNPTVFDYLGPWPYYILALEGIAFVTFLLLYAPFYIRKKAMEHQVPK